MPLITAVVPDVWQELEQLVTDILNECGMKATRQVTLKLPRGSVDVDVLAEETINGIPHRTICECKNWSANIPREVVHAFRTVMQETGAHRGYVISRVGFQRGAIEAAAATNIDLLTFTEFQNLYFDKWINKRIQAIEDEIGNFNTYYEPIGKPGYSKLKDNAERAAYDVIFDKYAFAGFMLMPFSPYLQIVGKYPFPALPFDTTQIEKYGIAIPDDIRSATTYREFLALLTNYGRDGLRALRAVNPLTRDKPPEAIERDA